MDKALHTFIKTDQLKQAVVAFKVLDLETGETVSTPHNEFVGMVPASTLKALTSVSAFAFLKPSYTFRTAFDVGHKLQGDTLFVHLNVIPGGDPSLGSERFASTKPEMIFKNVYDAMPPTGYNHIQLSLELEPVDYSNQLFPDHWTWEDLGNYFGAPAKAFNWAENIRRYSFDAGQKVGEPLKTKSKESVGLSEAVSGEKGSGDQLYLYFPVDGRVQAKGTLEQGFKAYQVKGSEIHPENKFKEDLTSFFQDKGVSVSWVDVPKVEINFGVAWNHGSPELRDLNEEFLKNSINLYGEAFLKQIAWKTNGFASTDEGLKLVREFWSNQGVDENEIKIFDGSGLSPTNRVSVNAMISVLQFAHKQPWFGEFEKGLSELNGLKLKSGYISGVLCYVGYAKNKHDKPIAFALMVNNFNGSTKQIKQEMFKLLNEIKYSP